MTEIDFFNILMDKLNTLPESQLYEIINYYKAYLSNNSTSSNKLEEILINLDDQNFINEILLNKDKPSNLEISSKIITKPNSNPSIDSDNITHEKHRTSINHNKSSNINIILKIGIITLLVLILPPILTTISAVTFSICKLNIKIVLTSFSLALGYDLNPSTTDIIPEFIFNFPKPSLFFFATGTSLLSLLLLFFVWYILKIIYIIIKTSFSKLNKHTNMEDL